ncbi:MAG: ABC transporter permease [Spirochaetia bacterium]|jgi:lipopolysaccharide transport system permease protein
MLLRKSNAAENGNANWTTIIRPQTGAFDFKIREIFQFKFLMFLFVRRDFVSQFKQTILGPLWFAIQPLFTTGIYSIIFGSLAKIPTDGIPQPVFYMAGTTLWNYFASCATSTGSILTSNAGVFGKVYFPRLTVPITTVVSKLFIFLIQLLLFLIVYFVYLINGAAMAPKIWLVFLPILLLHTALLGMAVGLWSSALTVKYRDLSYLIGFGMGLWMWATPIVYPLSLVPAKYRFLIYINPMAPIVEIFRYGFTGVGSFSLIPYLVSIGFTAILLFGGLLLFHRAEQGFIDVV